MKKIKGLRKKLIQMVFITVTTAVLLIFLVTICYYVTYQRENCIYDEKVKLQRVTYEVEVLQSLIDNVAKQVVADRVVSESLACSKKELGNYLYKRLRANEALAGYAHVVDSLQEIIIYAKSGETYSSLYAVRDPFKPEENEWYMDFKNRGVRTGFTKAHQSKTLKDAYEEEVISYVLTFYAADSSRKEQGDLIINIKSEPLQNMFSNMDDLVCGVTLFSGQGDTVYSQGEVSVPYETILENGESDRIKCPNGNVLLVDRNLKDGWFIVMELSMHRIYTGMYLHILIFLAAFAAIGAALIIVVSRYIRKIVDPIHDLTDSVAALSRGDFDVSVDIQTNDELEVLADGFNQMVNDIKRYMKESVEHEKLKRHMMVDKLMNQINPHFIYNTLNSIVYMAKIEGNKDIVKFTNSFISLLQGTLRVQDSIYVPLREELENIDHYLEIQEYRYTDKFVVLRDYDENALEALVPAVMLEPIVENAIFHGIAPKEGSAELKITIRKQEDILVIEVADDGIGMSGEMIEKLMSDTQNERGAIHKIGFANVRKRIKEIYGENCDLHISSQENVGTTISVRIPFMVSEDGETSLKPGE